MDAELKRELTWIKNTLVDIRNTAKQETWLSAVALRRITGWDESFLRLMRDNKVLKEKKNGKSVKYLLQSIPDQLLKPTL